MGKAVITENIGEGLYKAKILYNTAKLEAEKLGLIALNVDYWRILNGALDVRDALRKEKAAAAETLNALIQQWKDALYEKKKPPPPIIPEEAEEDDEGYPINPFTGLPYTDDERDTAVANDVLRLINIERAMLGLSTLNSTGLLTPHVKNRLNDLAGPPVEDFPDFQSDAYLQMLTRLKSIDDEGRRVHDRILNALPGIVVVSAFEAMGNGLTSAADVMDAWKRDPDTWAGLMNPDVTDAGVGYKYAPQLPGTHLWNAVTAKLGTAGDSASSWSADTEYGIGMTVTGQRRSNGGKILAKSIGRFGESGSTEPDWPASNIAIGDNDLVWLVLATIPPEPEAPPSLYG